MLTGATIVIAAEAGLALLVWAGWWLRRR